MATYAWKTPGLHKVTLQFADKTGNTNTYAFNVLVHNFVPRRSAAVSDFARSRLSLAPPDPDP